ncbi:MAG: coproporphyrinogen III oxidase, partial [Paludibacter sp.]
YCTRETTGQVYAFGTSAISQMWGTYAQNIKNLPQYMDAIEKTGIATERGYSMSTDETVIREVINEIMCNGLLDFDAMAIRLRTTADDIKRITVYDPAKLKQFEEDGLVEISEKGIQVSEDGMFVVRNIAMIFDPFLSIQPSQFSKVV